jgi:hypothetical protein
MATNPSSYGIVPPTTTGLYPGASSPGDSAIKEAQAQNQMHTALLNAVKGGKMRRRKIKGGTTASTIPISIFHTTYNSHMGPGQTPEDIQKAAISTTAQATANRQYDSEVAKPVPLVKGGTRLRSGRATKTRLRSGRATKTRLRSRATKRKTRSKATRRKKVNKK